MYIDSPCGGMGLQLDLSSLQMDGVQVIDNLLVGKIILAIFSVELEGCFYAAKGVSLLVKV